MFIPIMNECNYGWVLKVKCVVSSIFEIVNNFNALSLLQNLILTENKKNYGFQEMSIIIFHQMSFFVHICCDRTTGYGYDHQVLCAYKCNLEARIM